jgi:hypothetical protein
MTARSDRTPEDPKGLIHESFRIDGITAAECRSIFVDWALSVPGTDMAPLIASLLERHADKPDDHPMKAVLREGQGTIPKPRRRGGWAARHRPG